MTNTQDTHTNETAVKLDPGLIRDLAKQQARKDFNEALPREWFVENQERIRYSPTTSLADAMHRIVQTRGLLPKLVAEDYINVWYSTYQLELRALLESAFPRARWGSWQGAV